MDRAYFNSNYYDNKIKRNFSLDEKIGNVRSINTLQKRSTIHSFFSKPKNRLNNVARTQLQKVLDDMINSNTNRNNYDTFNGVWLEDLLYLFCNCNPKRPMIDMVQKQFEDMVSGRCGRARGSRLYMILSSILPLDDQIEQSFDLTLIDEDDEEETPIEIDLDDDEDLNEYEIEIEL